MYKLKFKIKYIIVSRHFSELFLILAEIRLGLIFGLIGLNLNCSKPPMLGQDYHERYFAGSASPNIKQILISAKMKS